MPPSKTTVTKGRRKTAYATSNKGWGPETKNNKTEQESRKKIKNSYGHKDREQRRRKLKKMKTRVNLVR